MFGVLITNDGVHSPEKWAAATASHIVSIAHSVAGQERAAAVKLEASVIDILEKHHGIVQAGERSAIITDSSRLAKELDANEHTEVEAVASEIISATNGTAWQIECGTEDFKAALVHLLKSHLHTNMHIERSHHADKNPDCPHGQAFKVKHNIGSK